MSKYEPLEQRLRSLTSDAWQTSFREIESILGTGLPRSAREYQAWWANNDPGSRQSGAWLNAGWRTDDLDVAGERVTFRRAGALSPQRSERLELLQASAPNRFASALAYAALIHARQKRKGTTIPYVSHVMSVSALVMEFDGDEDQAIAGLFHDALEDCGEWHEAVIRENWGERVARIVRACTDGVPDASGKKEPWRLRKERYLAHLRYVEEDVLLVSACDKLHNARAIAADLRAGHDVFARFNKDAGRGGTLWYYGELERIFRERLGETHSLYGEFAAAVAAMSAVTEATTMTIDVQKLDDDALQNLIDNHRRNKVTETKVYSDAIAELARRRGKGLDFNTTIAIIRNAAVGGRFISYGQVAEASGAEWSRVRYAMGPHLDRLIEYCHLNGLPLLSSIVVNQHNLQTGHLDPDSLKGFIAGVRGVGIPVEDEEEFLRRSQRAVFEWAREAGQRE